jgi:hypothetical protein
MCLRPARVSVWEQKSNGKDAIGRKAVARLFTELFFAAAFVPLRGEGDGHLMSQFVTGHFIYHSRVCSR